MSIDEYQRLRRAVANERLPLVVVDLDALEHNLQVLIDLVGPTGKTLRLASKSIRCPELLRWATERGAPHVQGIMAYAVEEAATLVGLGFRDVLVAYPTTQHCDVELLFELNGQTGVRVALVVDDVAQLGPLDDAARQRGVVVPVVLEADVSLRLCGGAIHIGARRSPLSTTDSVKEFAQSLRAHSGLKLVGFMAYESQIAGLPDRNPWSGGNWWKSLLRMWCVPWVRRRRARLAEDLATLGPLEIRNGGGTASLSFAAGEPALSELTAGSGLLCGHLFDYFSNLRLLPAAYFALQVVRKPGRDWVTCHGGGYVASGQAGPERLPRPVLPRGLSLSEMEGAGEVQTPLKGPGARRLSLGDPVFFRHAKSGEVMEHFNEVLLVRGDRVVGRWATYRGMGRAFLG